jgi:hypothetical protein
MMGISAVGFTFQMIVGTEPYSHGIFVLWAMLIGGTAALIAIQRWMAHRTRELRDASRALAQQLAGRPIESLDHFVAWLNRFWAAPYEQGQLQKAGLYGGAEGIIDGYAALAECSASSDRHRPKRLQLFLAAYVPGPSDGNLAVQPLPPAAEEQRRWLSQQGYEPSLTAGGLQLVAKPGVVNHVSKNLGGVAALAPILHHGALMLRGLGALPVHAIP